MTSTGSVKWGHAGTSARDAARFPSGVRGVSNNVTLEPSVQPTAVRDAIETALRRTGAEIDAANVEVSTAGGKVTLAGNVRSHGRTPEGGRPRRGMPPA